MKEIYKYNDIFKEEVYSVKKNGYTFKFINKPGNKIGVVFNVFSGAVQELRQTENGVIKYSAGIAHFIEHLKITSFKDLLNQGYINGYVQNGGTTLSMTNFTMNANIDTFYNETMDVFFRMCLGFDFTIEDINREKNVILNEMNQIHANSKKNKATYSKIVDSATNLEIDRQIIGYPDTISKIDENEIREFYRHNYVKENSHFCVIGNFDNVEKVTKFLDKFAKIDESVAQVSSQLIESNSNFVQSAINKVNFKNIEVHEGSNEGFGVTIFLGINSNIDIFNTSVVEKMKWFEFTNYFVLPVIMFQNQIANEQSKINTLFMEKFGISLFNECTFINRQLGYASFIEINLSEKFMDLNIYKVKDYILDLFTNIDLYFDQNIINEVNYLNQFNKFKVTSTSFADAFTKVSFNLSNYANNPVIFDEFNENILKLTKEDLVNTFEKIEYENYTIYYRIKEEL